MKQKKKIKTERKKGRTSKRFLSAVLYVPYPL